MAKIIGRREKNIDTIELVDIDDRGVVVLIDYLRVVPDFVKPGQYGAGDEICVDCYRNPRGEISDLRSELEPSSEQIDFRAQTMCADERIDMLDEGTAVERRNGLDPFQFGLQEALIFVHEGSP
jgi:hypothetical protein